MHVPIRKRYPLNVIYLNFASFCPIMDALFKEINKLRKTDIKNRIESRLNDFRKAGKEGNKRWFSELCFCLLTANAKAKTALAVEKDIGYDGYTTLAEKELVKCLLRNKHRFHNTKAARIVEARQHLDIKNKVAAHSTEQDARAWLIENVKGLGYKESSHFLRNVGYTSLAILDRHILNLMHEHGFLEKIPKPATKKNYLGIEEKFRKIAEQLGMNLAELDLYMWHMKTGEVLK